jgi:hypothetical protein
LKLGVGARSLGMGEAYSAVGTDPSATYYNPAALASASVPQLLLMHKEWIQDTKTEFLAGSTVWGDLAAGVSVNSTSVDDIELRSLPGPPLSTFDARDAAIGVSAAYAIDPSVSVGITGKYLYEKILVDESSGFGIDLGGLYQTPWGIRIAAVVGNLGSMNKLQQEAPVLPRFVRTGLAYEASIPSMDGTIMLASDVVSYTEEKNSHLHLGGEFDYQHTIAARVGYQTGYDAKSFSAGVGLRYEWLRFDYAFVPFKTDLGTTHTFSLGIDFE